MTTTSPVDVNAFINTVNTTYEQHHRAYEDNFWSTKMDLAGASNDALTRTKADLDNFLGDEAMLKQVDAMLAGTGLTPEQTKILQCFQKTFRCYILSDPDARALRDQLGTLEADLAQGRNKMLLGYANPSDGSFTKASSVQLRTTMRTSEDPKLRRACFDGMNTIGVFVIDKFCEIIKMRNRLARKVGYVDYYDMKVQQAEGMSKKELFVVLEDLETKTRPVMAKARETLSQEKGPEALLPENMGYYLAGDVTKLKDPYFPFQNAVDVWARSFAGMGIGYKGATMRLDLCDRQGKYSNGFCHWPQPAWVSPSGWVPSSANFTSLASPQQVGSGLTAITTLMHEAGHAAHFANVIQGSPLFSQERAPTSVAYAENQSMFLDSLVGDAAWIGRYAVSLSGEVIPWAILEKDIRATHNYKVFALRAMLAVPFYERALYELPEADVTPAKVTALAQEIENSIQGGLSGRPLLSVPHILSDESSAYYHGYVLAEMSVHQTRKHFLTKYGTIVDNPQVGADLAEWYWKSGNSEMFLTLVEGLTGRPLRADAWVEELAMEVEAAVADEAKEYAAAVKAGPTIKVGGAVDLDMRVLLVHGDETVADSNNPGGLVAACATYSAWLSKQ